MFFSHTVLNNYIIIYFKCRGDVGIAVSRGDDLKFYF